MKLDECTPGLEVVIGLWFLPGYLGGTTCTVIDTRPAPEKPEHNPAYPKGMVQVRLPGDSAWQCKEPWIGPEHLYPAPARERVLRECCLTVPGESHTGICVNSVMNTGRWNP